MEAATAKQHGRINGYECYHHLLAHLTGVVPLSMKATSKMLMTVTIYSAQRVYKHFRDAGGTPTANVYLFRPVVMYSNIRQV